MDDASPARAALEALQGHEAWAIIRRSTRAGDRDTVGMIGGRRRVVESLLDVPLEEGPPAAGHIADRLLAVPFRQIAERGFEVHDDGTPLVMVDIESEREFSVAEVIDAIDDTGIEFDDRGGFETGDEDYGRARRLDHRATRSARAREPTSSSGGTTARPSPTGARTRR